MVPLRHELKNGDIVQVLTQKGHKPSRDWLTFVKTSRARNKIRTFLSATERTRSIEIGRKLLDKEARKTEVSLKQVSQSEALRGSAPRIWVQQGRGALRRRRLRKGLHPRTSSLACRSGGRAKNRTGREPAWPESCSASFVEARTRSRSAAWMTSWSIEPIAATRSQARTLPVMSAEAKAYRYTPSIVRTC